MADSIGQDAALSEQLYLSEEFASSADLSDNSCSSLTQFLHSPLPLRAIKEFACQLTSRRRRKRKVCFLKCTDEPNEELYHDDCQSSCQLSCRSENASRALDSVIHLYVGRYLRDTRHFLRHNLNKKFKACDLDERLRCRREQQQGPMKNCGSCSWAHGDSLHMTEPPILVGSTELFRFVGGAKRLLHHASAYVTPYVYVFGGMTPSGKSDGLWALNVCEGYWRNIQLSNEIKLAESSPPTRFGNLGNTTPVSRSGGWQSDGYSGVALPPPPQSNDVMFTSPHALVPNDYPEPRFSHTLNAYKDRLLILFGGDRGPGELNDLWIFDSRTKIWTEEADLPQKPPPRSSHSSVIWNDQLIIFGGAGGLEMFNDLWSYDLIRSKWTELIPAGATSGAADGRDGFSADSAFGAVLRPEGRSGHTCAISDNRLLVFGGSSYQTVYGDVWCIDLSVKPLFWEKIITKGSGPSPRSRHSGIMIEENEWLIFGGKHGAFCYNCDLFTLNTRTFVWRREVVFRPNRTHKRDWWNSSEIIRQLPQLHCHSMSYDHNRGVLVVTGGCDGDGSAKDSTLLIKKASTAPIVFEEWYLCGDEILFGEGSLPRFIKDHYDPYAFELLKYL